MICGKLTKKQHVAFDFPDQCGVLIVDINVDKSRIVALQTDFDVNSLSGVTLTTVGLQQQTPSPWTLMRL